MKLSIEMNLDKNDLLFNDNESFKSFIEMIKIDLNRAFKNLGNQASDMKEVRKFHEMNVIINDIDGNSIGNIKILK